LERCKTPEAGKRIGLNSARKESDFVLVDGDPSRNISDIRRCRLVAKNGTLYKSDAVYAAVGIKPAE
jgi:imidazolonepropionase-like amidohydrolase